MTYQIIYSSQSTTPMQWEDLEEILEQARDSNAALGITGALAYAEGVFLQVLEGDKASVEALMASIGKDLRHETVTVLRAADIPSALFGDWKMAYVSATAAQVAEWAGFGGLADGQPNAGDLQQDPQRAAQIAQQIRSLLAPENSTLNKPG